MAWDNTGSLTAIGNTSNGTIRYTYLSDGQRRTKTINGKTTTYRYNNGMPLPEQTGDETLRYYYYAAGKVASLTYKHTKRAATQRSVTSTPETSREISSPSAGLKAAAISGAIGAAVGAGTSVVSNRVSTGSWEGSGKAALDGTVNGFADGFMVGGIMAGGSQALSGGFKLAAEAGIKTGATGGIKGTGILAPNRLRTDNEIATIGGRGQSFYDYGGQLFKIGSIKMDIGSKTFLHMHTGFTGSKHIPVGIIESGLYGGLEQW